MVAAEESETNQQFSARNSSYLDHMALLQHEQNHNLPISPSMVASNVAFSGHYVSDFCGLNTDKHDLSGGVLKPVYPYCNIPHPTRSRYLNNAHGIGITDKVINTSCTPQKRFLIFDQSKNHTRLFFSPPFPSQNQFFSYKTPTDANGLYKETTVEPDEKFLMKPVLEEDWGENDLTDREGKMHEDSSGEMHEDTEEINALLYSDEDDDDDEDDDKSDEVTSTGHSPSIIGEGRNKEKLVHEELREVANSDESPKRQKLPDGKYQKSSSTNAKSRMTQPVSQCYGDDVESSCAGDAYSHDECKREKKAKIREALLTLVSIIPGLNNKDPLSIIDEAIIHLKSLKTEAVDLQRGHPGCSISTTTPPPHGGSFNGVESLKRWVEQETTKHVF